MGEQLSSNYKEASGAETSGKDTDSNDVVHESKSKREELVKESVLTPLISSSNAGSGGDELKPKQKRVRKKSKGKGRGSSSSDGNAELKIIEIVADDNVSSTVDAPINKDSSAQGGNEESRVEAGESEVVKTSDMKCNILTSPGKQDSPGEIGNGEVEVSSGSSKKKGKMDKKSPVKVKTPVRNGDSLGE